MQIIRIFLDVHQLNPLTGYFTHGLSPYAAWSFMSALNTAANTDFNKVGIIQHEVVSAVNENIKRSFDAAPNGASPLPMSAERFANAKVSLYLQTPSDDPLDYIAIANAIQTLRFQGGKILNYLTDTDISENTLSLNSYEYFEPIEQAPSVLSFIQQQETAYPESKNPFSAIFLKSQKQLQASSLDDYAQALFDGSLLCPVGYRRFLSTTPALTNLYNLDITAVEPVFILIDPLQRYSLKNPDHDLFESFMQRFFFEFDHPSHQANPALHILC